jgi:hypothetical protein
MDTPTEMVAPDNDCVPLFDAEMCVERCVTRCARQRFIVAIGDVFVCTTVAILFRETKVDQIKLQKNGTVFITYTEMKS